MTDLVVTATLDGSGAPFRVAATDLYLAVSGQTLAEVNSAGSVAQWLPNSAVLVRPQMMSPAAR